MTSCIKITDEGIAALVKGCPNVTSLSASYCSSITDLSIDLLTMHCNHLQALNLQWCDEITNMSLHYIGSRLQRYIEVLNVSCCNKISDLGIVDLLDCVCLQSLNISMCEGITDGCLPALTDLCRNGVLTEVDVMWTSISDEGIKSIQKNMSTLRMMHSGVPY